MLDELSEDVPVYKAFDQTVLAQLAADPDSEQMRFF